MRQSGLIAILSALLVFSLAGIHRLNKYVHREQLFPITRYSSDVILSGTPARFQKNVHVKKEITQKKGKYHIKYAFKDHLDIPRIWSVTFPSKQTNEMIYKFGVDPRVYEPFERSAEVIVQRKMEINAGLFKEEDGYVMPDLNAIAAYYKGFTKPIADFIRVNLGSGAGKRESLDFALSFCQDIPYGIPPSRFNEKEIGEMFSPPQALLNMFGDCDTKAVIFTSTMSHFGWQDMIYIQVPGHLLMGIEGLPRPYDAYVQFKNKKYIFAEPVGPGRYRLGEVRQAYPKLGGVIEVDIDKEYEPVPYTFIELDEEDPFLLSVRNAYSRSKPISTEDTGPSAEVFGNRASDDQGQISIWINSPDFGEVTVLIDDEEFGTLTHYFDETPSCGQPGTLSVLKPPGTYPFKAQSAAAIWEGDAVFTANSCLILEIGK